MIHLESHLDHLANPCGFHLDMEYERFGRATKSLQRSGGSGPPWRKIVPDLIYHQRGNSRRYSNHLALEIKVRPARRLEEHDLAKLSLLTGRERYAFVSGKLLSCRASTDPADPPPGCDVVTLPEGFEPYTYGALLRLYEVERYLCWI
jgi:hypothetical protein